MNIRVRVSALAISAICLLSCVVNGPLNKNDVAQNIDEHPCFGACSSEFIHIEKIAGSLTLLALSVQDDVICSLQCARTAQESTTGDDGLLVCAKNHSDKKPCSRRTLIHVLSFTFVSEGEDSCEGGGAQTPTMGNLEKCDSLKDGVTKALQHWVTTIDGHPCKETEDSNDCGYVVRGTGIIVITEKQDEREVTSTLSFEKICRKQDVLGMLDEYEISGDLYMFQELVHEIQPKTEKK